MHVPFTSFHKESSVPGYSRRYLCRYLKFWWRELEKMELVSNGTRSSLDRPLHGSFSKFLVNGKRPRSRKKIGWAWYRKMCGVGKRSINLSLPRPRVFFAIVFMISPHYFLEAWNRLVGSLPVPGRFWNSIICNHFFRTLSVKVKGLCYCVFKWLNFRNLGW